MELSRAPAAHGPTNGAPPVDTAAVFVTLDKMVVPPLVPEAATPEVAPPDAPETAGPDCSASADAEMPASNTKNEPKVGDPFTSFIPESEAIAPVPVRPHASPPKGAQLAQRPRRRVESRITVAVVVVCASVVAGWFAWQTWTATAASAPLSSVAATGTADVNSVPQGSSVAIDGAIRGVTPLRVSLAAGTHNVTITNGAVSRTFPITVTPGGTVSQFVEFATAPPTVGGRLEIGSDPPGALVAIDGMAQGWTPLVLADVAPGRYRITVSSGGNAVNRTVNVTPGTTSALVVSTAPVGANSAAAPRDAADHDHRRGLRGGPAPRHRHPEARAVAHRRLPDGRHPHRPLHARLRRGYRARLAARGDRRRPPDVRRRPAFPPQGPARRPGIAVPGRA